ncbi:hypothetical protein DACRYDRAFT_117921 [Dacryopinax primogenitus]|uniref:Uncharacterized protein n=1 Tax=Dacryopinax primogenitus (strain DJM 731) TaxID=1858805 RepID=M5FVV9_DACPD|nr:uncharacterized protein DACRYDRAFT_117921 [Dacryopinax primogenitus]EJT99749.1 hypothetical protein DACRYDRAFT_117921 [Dacryopinax primogenitus]
MSLPPHALRKYADLIFTGSRLQWSPFYPSAPSSQVQCGDYGFLSPETGAFKREGNIYDEGIARRWGIKQPEVVEGEVEKESWTISKNARALAYGKDCRVPDAQIQKFKRKGHVSFLSDRGAVLVTLDSRTLSIPQKTQLKSLLSEPGLQGKHLVSEVVQCSKYARYMSGPAGGDLCLGYDGTSWHARGLKEGDSFTSGTSPNPKFSALFRLLVVQDRGPILLLRDSPEPEDPTGLLAPLYPAWGVLDEQGEVIQGWGWEEEGDLMREVGDWEGLGLELGKGWGSVPVSPPASV